MFVRFSFLSRSATSHCNESKQCSWLSSLHTLLAHLDRFRSESLERFLSIYKSSHWIARRVLERVLDAARDRSVHRRTHAFNVHRSGSHVVRARSSPSVHIYACMRVRRPEKRVILFLFSRDRLNRSGLLSFEETVCARSLSRLRVLLATRWESRDTKLSTIVRPTPTSNTEPDVTLLTLRRAHREFSPRRESKSGEHKRSTSLLLLTVVWQPHQLIHVSLARV